jgi:hypothetical protein
MIQLDQSALKARNRLLVLFLLLSVLDLTLVIIAQDRWAIGSVMVVL